MIDWCGHEDGVKAVPDHRADVLDLVFGVAGLADGLNFIEEVVDAPFQLLVLRPGFEQVNGAKLLQKCHGCVWEKQVENKEVWVCLCLCLCLCVRVWFRKVFCVN